MTKNPENKNHLRNLISLMHADGKIVDEEKSFIIQLGKKMGFEQSVIEHWIAENKHYQYSIPDSITRRYAELYEMIGLISIDGNIHKSELKLLHKIAGRFGFRKEIINAIIKGIQDFILKGFSQNTLDKDYSTMFKTV